MNMWKNFFIACGLIFITCGCGPAKKQADTINNINLPGGQNVQDNVYTAINEIKEKQQELSTAVTQAIKQPEEEVVETLGDDISDEKKIPTKIEASTNDIDKDLTALSLSISDALEKKLGNEVFDSCYLQLKELEADTFELALQAREAGVKSSDLASIRSLFKKISINLYRIRVRPGLNSPSSGDAGKNSLGPDLFGFKLQEEAQEFFEDHNVTAEMNADAATLAKKFAEMENGTEMFHLFRSSFDLVRKNGDLSIAEAFEFSDRLTGINVFKDWEKEE